MVGTFPLQRITISLAQQGRLRGIRIFMSQVIREIETSTSSLRMACLDAKEQQPKLDTEADVRGLLSK